MNTVPSTLAGSDGRWRFFHQRPLLASLAANPALILFLSANIVNAGNLAFNVVFSRAMGPDAFGNLALLLTVKLSVLSVLNALQLELATRVAGLAPGPDRLAAGKEINRICGRIIKYGSALMALLLLAGAWLTSTAMADGNGAMPLSMTYLVFAISIPFMVPLGLVRGWSQGSLCVRRIVLSAQVEMIVRFAGAWIAFESGLGLPGIAGAIVLSIIAGWYFARPKQGASAPLIDGRQTHTEAQTLATGNVKPKASLDPRVIMVAAMPWAALQLGQVLSLDGDYIVTRLFFEERESGLVAVSALVQRILFFGCFGLATALLPLAVNADTRQKMASALLPVAAMVGLACIPFIALMAFFPDIFINSVFGPAYMDAARLLLPSAISGSAFVVIYLIATFFMARFSRKTGYLLLGAALVQLAIMTVVAVMKPEDGMHAIVVVKACTQLVTATIMGVALYRAYRKLDHG